MPYRPASPKLLVKTGKKVAQAAAGATSPMTPLPR